MMMMMMMIPWIVFVLILLIVTTECGTQCIFPKYLKDPLADGSGRYWITETRFIDNTNLWEGQLEITVEESEIVAKLKYKAQCHEFAGTVPCFLREGYYRRTCLRDEGDGRYLVQHRDNGRSYYTCIRFVQRNRNVIQVWTSPHRDDVSDELCRDQSLVREEWPWLAPKLEEWVPCPLEGGFDFRTYMYERRQKLCHRNWRPSRLESECVRGEGMEFLFPEKTCSPFFEHQESVFLQCWADWIEEEYHFIVASMTGKTPQFVLRFPRELEMNPEFHVELYFSPVCPVDRSGIPAGNRDIRRAELKMKRSEPGLCYDEAEACKTFEDEDKCANSALHQYANFCKKSCGLCKLLPSTRPECKFPDGYKKEWYLFETDRQELVRIEGGHVSFSTMGEFICKGKHWSDDHYKLLSKYQNGCRPRYTCLHFMQLDDNTLQYQISRSARSDLSFRICTFQDDPAPLGGLVRSDLMKTLLPASRTKSRSCGLNGIVQVNATIPGGKKCAGTLSDYDQYTCTSGARLTLSLPMCNNGEDSIYEFLCIAYVNMDDSLSFLITSPVDGGQYSCWIVRTYPERMSYKPWKEAHMLYRAQCGTEEDMDPAVAHVTALSIFMSSDHVSSPCGKRSHDRHNIGHSSTPKSVIAKEIRATQNDNTKNSGRRPYTHASVGSVHHTRTYLATLVCIVIFWCLKTVACIGSCDQS